MHKRADFAGAGAPPNLVSRLPNKLSCHGAFQASTLQQYSEEQPVGAWHVRPHSHRAVLNVELVEERIGQLQRLELMHMMSAGIAHDFKNIMQIIESYAAVLQGQAEPDELNHVVATGILAAAERGNMLTNRWLEYSRHGELQKQAVQLGEFVDRCGEKIKFDLHKSIHMEILCGPDPVECDLDPCLTEQVLFNLCLNARDAMPHGGVLQVLVERVAFDSQSSSHDLLPAGVYGKLSVTDSGTGIPPDILQRVFEPFFTTKSAETGTGLGLALVRSIIAEHHGAIEVRSEVGVGSEFTIYLPGR